MRREPEYKEFPESAFHKTESEQSKKDRSEDKDHPAQERPPVQIGIQIRQPGRQGQFFCEHCPGVLDTLDHASRPADPLTDHALHRSRGQSRGKHLRRGICDISRFLQPETCLKIFRYRIVRKSSDLLQRRAQDHRIASRICRRICGVPHHIDLTGKEILLIGDILFREQIELKQILVIKALGRLDQPHPDIRCQKIRHRSYQELSPGYHVCVKCRDQRRRRAGKGIVVVSRLGMPVFGKSQIPGSQVFCQFPDLPSVSVVADIDVYLVFFRIFQKGTGINRLVQKSGGFVVGGNEHIHIREAL